MEYKEKSFFQKKAPYQGGKYFLSKIGLELYFPH